MVTPRTQTPEPARAVQEASWRGVVFQLEEVGGTRGRRGQETQYPYQDETDYDDLGRALREHSVTGFLIGPGWEAQRDALIKAVEQPGPGAFVHPWLGQLTCRCRSMQESHSSSERGVFRFTLDLLEVRADSAVRRVAPIESQDGTERVDRASEACLGRLKDEWVASFALGDVPAGLFQSAAMGLLSNPAAGAAMFAAAWRLSEEAYLTARSWFSDAFYQAATSLDPDTFPDFWTKGVLTFDDLPLIRQFWDVFIRPDSIRHSPTTPGRIAANAHLELVWGFAPGVLVAEWARLSTLEVYESATAATDERDRVLEALDAELDKSHRSEVYFALMELRAALVRDFDRLLQRLAPVILVRQARVEPAVVTAYRRYQDVDRAEEVLDLNDAVHPLFLPASEPIRALEW